MLKLKKLTETYGMKVFTDGGEYFGDVDEVIIQNNKIFGWKVKATRDSFLSKTVSGAKGVIIPHQLVKAVGDVMIISKAAVPSGEEEKKETEEA
ncbi:MAG: PRC-barrel domain-containing protein [Candidatus Parvarchaeota archaeon]|nr:PRC-barrel domain-containing protein [Candidatus Jingweiarchaeum tengchongense]MCW1297869.1 PRC-barrel domain-containing protein [Candidatus Jingweiarchaeum tengchongense]MCW1299880.1 PRC-barrel domain-containing protein [Candidatus Jingweiarchaeum tengchongense]MCW1305116.1 PRC-barrel domain-containing protein [Candidatus Jingweiarchaeum tengchongense]MCW1305178.1 PRC-barrel domain-containing protein [Candidatus Jingweiarchaeum tengchongense]